jgi:hypothetical protein
MNAFHEFSRVIRGTLKCPEHRVTGLTEDEGTASLAGAGSLKRIR